MKFFQKIRNKLLFVFLSFGILIIISGGISLYFILNNYLTNYTYFQLDILTNQKKEQIELFFKDRISEIELLTHSDEITKIAKEFENTSNLESIAKELNFLSSSNYYSNFFISNGKKIFTSKFPINFENNNFDKNLFGSIYETSWIRNSIWGKTVLTDYNDATNHKNLIIASPILIEDKVVGMIGVEISSARINEILYSDRKEAAFSKTGDLFVVGRDYQIRSKNRFFDIANSNQKFLPQLVKDVFEIGVIKFLVQNEKSDLIFVSGKRIDVPFLNWAIFSTIEEAEALGLIANLEKNFIVILIAFIIGMIFLSYFLASRITKPINKLQIATKDIGEGEFSISVDETGNDEITELAISFNQMAVNLKEKTEALKEREMRLFHLYSATNDGIILYDNDEPVLVNRTMERLTGFLREEIRLKKVSEILNFPKINYRENDNTISFETTILRKDNSFFPAEIQIRKIQYFGKQIDACVIRDITRRREVENELVKTKQLLISSIFDGIEKERQRLARELHDGLGQSMIALQMQLQQALNEKNGKSAELITKVINNMDGAIEEIRNISNDLIPAVLLEFGLSNALKKMCSDLDLTSKSNIVYEGKVLQNPPNHRTIKYLYRIAQEALRNAIKHSDANRIVVSLIEEENKIILIIKDDGKGFNFSKNRNGFGLHNMKERVQILGGKIKIKSEENKGVEIKVIV